MIGILGAMDIEIEGLRTAAPLREEKIGGHIFYTGKIGSSDVAVAKCGIGKVNAAMCCQLMISRFSPELVINTGVAGSLCGSLAIGDIVIADNVCQHDFDTTALGDEPGLLPGLDLVKIPADADAAARLCEIAASLGINYAAATVASGDCFVADAEKKRRIVDVFGAAACEMEGGAIGQVCRANGTPFAVLRALSDSANEGSCEDYPAFCRLAADRSVKILLEFLK